MKLKLLVAAILLGASACESATEPFQNVYVETAVGPLAGAPRTFLITTTIVNASRKAITFETNTCGRGYLVETTDGDYVAPITSGACSAYSAPVTVRRGDSYTYQERWNGKDFTGAVRSGSFNVYGMPFVLRGPRSKAVAVTVP